MNLNAYLLDEQMRTLQNERHAEARLSRMLKQLRQAQRQNAARPSNSQENVPGRSGSLKPAI